LETLTIILQSAPYGDEKVYNAFRISQALVSASIDMKVNIFLTGDGVLTAKRGQKTPRDFYNLEVTLRDLLRKGVKVVACRTCVSARGLTQGELIEGVVVGSTVGDLAKWIKESQKVLTF
jgi:uncharacterized protein involved in oxidation of intracellular sulfur